MGALVDLSREKPDANAAPGSDAEAEANRKKTEELASKAFGDLHEYVRKSMRGCEPNAHEMRGAVFASLLMADRNTREFETRLQRLEGWARRSWFSRLFHRRPKFEPL